MRWESIELVEVHPIYKSSKSRLKQVRKLENKFKLLTKIISDAYEAEQLLKEVDIHSVTGNLKSYLRELPEALFTDQYYQRVLV